VPKADSQVQRLLASRRDVFDGYHEEGFRDAVGRHFEIVEAAPIPGTVRVLFHLRRPPDTVGQREGTSAVAGQAVGQVDDAAGRG
jgi:hypothetical protein